MIRLENVALSSGVLVLLELHPASGNFRQKLSVNYHPGHVAGLSAVPGVDYLLNAEPVFSVGEGKWHCVTLEVAMDEEMGHASAWVDGTLIKHTGPINSIPGGNLGRLLAGNVLALAPSGSQATLLIDQISLSRERISCPVSPLASVAAP